MKVKVRYPSSARIITLTEDAPILQTLLSEIYNDIPVVDSIKFGFPPKSIDLSDPARTLKELGISSGDQLVVTPPSQGSAPAPVPVQAAAPVSASSTQASSATTPSRTTSKPNSDKYQVEVPMYGQMDLQIMKDDNSCLFRAVGYTVLQSVEESAALREIVASTVAREQDVYTDAILGRSRQQYIDFIKKSTSWGGAIELLILSKHFGITIASFDIANLRLDEFNPGQERFVLLIYSGIHYDAVSLTSFGATTAIFDKDFYDVLKDSVMKLGKKLKDAHYYTDTAKFTLRCNKCGTSLVGQKEATEHAKSTGHVDFGEFK